MFPPRNPPRHSRCLAAAAGLLCLLAAACAYVGAPLPPATNIARPVQDVQITQQEADLRIRFTLPQTATDDLPLAEPGEVELLLGPLTPGAFSWPDWQARSARVPVTLPEEGFSVDLRLPAAPWVGQELAAAVRLINRKGKRSEWSNLARLRVIAALPPPATVTAENIPEGLRVSFSHSSPDPQLRYRILRQARGEGVNPQAAPEQIAVAAQSPFVDHGVRFGLDYVYSVIAEIQSGDIRAESAPLTAAPVRRQDLFPPPPPTSLTAISGLESIELTWERVTAEDLAGFRLYRAAGEADFVLLAELPLQYSFSDRNLASGARYRYAVSAVDASGNESARSHSAEASAP